MRKILLILSMQFSLLANAQNASGYLGKRFSVNLGYACNFLMEDITSKRGYQDFGDSYSYNKHLINISSRSSINLEYAVKNYLSLGMETDFHRNVIVIENRFNTRIINGTYSLVPNPVNLSCVSFMPYLRFFQSNMSPAPVGNYFFIGATYTKYRLDSAQLLLNPGNSLYTSNGKASFYGLSAGIGRSFITKKSVLFRVEISFPYVFQALNFPQLDVLNNSFIIKKSEFYDLETSIKNKIIRNNWFNYKFTIGLPF